MNALGGKRDRGQRVLDLVRHAPRYFAPGCLFLRSQQVRQVFEHQHVSQSLGGVTQRRHGYGDIQLSSGQREFHVGCRDAHTIGAAEQRFQVREHVGGDHVSQGEVHKRRRTDVLAPLQIKHPGESGVRKRHVARRVNRNHARWNTFEDRFDVPASAFQRRVRIAHIAAGGFNLVPAGFELFRHAVERLHQFGQFVSGADIDAIVQLPFGDGLGTRRQRRHRTIDQLRKQEREPGRSEQHHHGQQEQESDVGPPKQLSFRGQFDVALLAFLNLPGRLGEFWRERHGDQHGAVGQWGGRDNVVRLAPLEMGVLSAQGRLHREDRLHGGPARRSVQTGGHVAACHGQNESALQRRPVLPKFRAGDGEIFAGKGSLKFVRLCDGLRFRGCVLARVIIEQSRHGLGIRAHFFDRLREPLVDGAVHQPIREPEHRNHGQKRQQQADHHQARAEL